MALFHKDVFLPRIKLPTGVFSLNYTQHALDKQKSDKYGKLTLPKMLDTSKAEVVELELDSLGIAKIAYRLPMDKYRDLSIVVIPGKTYMKVKTVWSNPWNDKHSTLQRNRYVGG